MIYRDAIIVNGRGFSDLSRAEDYADWLENRGRRIVVTTPRPETRRRFQCERCGGTGHQVDGLWDGKAYASVAGVCDDCGGEGKLGLIPRLETRHEFG